MGQCCHERLAIRLDPPSQVTYLCNSGYAATAAPGP